MTSDGTLTIDLAGQRRVLQQSDVLTFGRAADLVIDEENPYMHRIVGRFFWHGGSWWLENLGSFIELEVVPEGGTSLKLPPSEPESTPVVHALAPPSFVVRFESNNVTYEVAGLLDQVQASLSAASQMQPSSNGSSAADIAIDLGAPAPSNGSFAPSNGQPDDLAPVPAPGPLGEQAFAPPLERPGVPEPAPAASPFADFGSVPPPSPARDELAPPSGPEMLAPRGPAPNGASLEVAQFVLSPAEQDLLRALAEPWLAQPGSGAQPLPSDRDLAERLGRPPAHVTRKLTYLCNRLTRSGVPGLQGGGDRRSALVRHALDTGLIG